MASNTTNNTTNTNISTEGGGVISNSKLLSILHGDNSANNRSISSNNGSLQDSSTTSFSKIDELKRLRSRLESRRRLQQQQQQQQNTNSHRSLSSDNNNNNKNDSELFQSSEAASSTATRKIMPSAEKENEVATNTPTVTSTAETQRGGESALDPGNTDLVPPRSKDNAASSETILSSHSFVAATTTTVPLNQNEKHEHPETLTTPSSLSLAETLVQQLADQQAANEALKEQLAETQRIQELRFQLESAKQEAELMQQQIANLQGGEQQEKSQEEELVSDGDDDDEETEEHYDKFFSKPDPEEEKPKPPAHNHTHNNVNNANKTLQQVGRYDSFLQAYEALQDGSTSDPRKTAKFHAADLLQLTMKDHGTRAHGIVFLELWIVKDARLFRPNHGWWMDHDINIGGNMTGRGGSMDSLDDNVPALAYPCNLCRLAVPERPDYVPATEQLFGEGLPGVLWSEAMQQNEGGGVGGAFSEQRRVLWRQLKSIVMDPLQPSSPRMDVLGKCELDHVAAVTFNICGVRGLCIWMAHQATDTTQLMATSNETFMAIATDHIAATYALRLPREVATAALRRYEANVLRKQQQQEQRLQLRKKKKEKQEQRDSRHGDEEQGVGGGLVDLDDDISSTASFSDSSPPKKKQNKIATCLRIFAKNAKVFLRKFKGGGLKHPPAFGWTQTAFSFVGSLVTLLAITQMDQWFAGGGLGIEATLVIGPFGAYVVLLYGLTAAPASQPRNAIVGNIIGMLVGMGMSNLDEYLELWLRMSLASATATAIMVKIGVTHPPGGALALIFSTGTLTWSKMYIQLCGTVIAIAIGAVVNNLNPIRQYPTYWGFEEFIPRFGPSNS